MADGLRSDRESALSRLDEPRTPGAPERERRASETAANPSGACPGVEDLLGDYSEQMGATFG